MSRRRVIARRYELVRPVGRGGMGEVWAGYDQRLDRPIAVKLLRKDLFPGGQARSADLPTRARRISERFVREARSTARIEHPGVPAVYDAGADEGELFLVMQLISGISLADLLAEGGALDLGQCAAIGAQIASILSVAHAAALVHRDLKPGNVIVTHSGDVKVLDFGIAAVLEPDITRLTAADETLGSPAYMAPEQVLHAQVSPRTDLYALGCVLYEMLTGGQVFDGQTSYALMQAHVDRSPPPVGGLRPDAPLDLCALVGELLAKDPDDRPAQAATVYERLIAHVPTEPGVHRGPGMPDPTRPFRRPLAPAGGPVAPSPGTSGRAASATDAGVAPLPEQATRAPAGGPTVAVDVAAVQGEATGLIDDGRFTQAADLLSWALGTVEVHRPGSADERQLRLLLANTLILGEDFAAALPLYSEVLSGHDVDDNLAVFCRQQVAICLAAVGRTTAALDHLTALSELQTARLGPTHVETAEVRRQIVMLTASSGDIPAAVDQLKRLIDEVVSSAADGADLAELRRLLDHLERLDAGG